MKLVLSTQQRLVMRRFSTAFRLRRCFIVFIWCRKIVVPRRVGKKWRTCISPTHFRYFVSSSHGQRVVGSLWATHEQWAAHGPSMKALQPEPVYS